MSSHTRNVMDNLAEISRMVQDIPEAKAILDEIRAGRLNPDRAMDLLTDILLQSRFKEQLVQAAEYVNLLDGSNPILEAMVSERSSLDGDVPEARFDPIAPGGRPAVPVYTDSRDPVMVGWLLDQASLEVAAEIQHALAAHERHCERMLETAKQSVPPQFESLALDVARKNMPAPPTGVRGYEAGKVASMRRVSQEPPMMATLPSFKRREYAYKAIATTQGRVSLNAVVEKGVAEALGVSVRFGVPDPNLAVVARWTTNVWGVKDISEDFNFVETAIAALAANLKESLQGGTRIVLQVQPYHGIADRQFGWVAVASVEE